MVIRPNTIANYTNIIENHIIPALGDIRLTKLQSIQIQRFYNDLKEHGRLDSKAVRTDEPLSSSMVRHAHMVLSGALKQAVKERIIPFNPCDNCRIPKKEKKEMTILPPEKIRAYLDEAKRLGVYEMFFLELTSGLRRGELLALLWTDLDIENCKLTVNKQVNRINGEFVVSEPKTQNSIRTVALPQQTVELLIAEHHRHPDSALMFCSPRTNSYWSPDTVVRLHKKMLAAAGVEDRVRFHDLQQKVMSGILNVQERFSANSISRPMLTLSRYSVADRSAVLQHTCFGTGNSANATAGVSGSTFAELATDNSSHPQR